MTVLLRVLLLAAVVLALAACGDEPERSAGVTGGSTLRGTLVDPDGDGALERGPGMPLTDRTELARPSRPGRVVASVGQLTDTHVTDEESPARVPFIDRFGGDVNSAFRPQESMSAQVLAGAVRALNAEDPQAVLVTGDIIDNAQRNELATARAVLDGGRVRPDTGARGYRGVQQGSNPDPLYYRPDQDAPRHPGLLARAQRPFSSPGLRAPWFPALGNHDVLRQGELPASPDTDAVATGADLITALDREFRLPERTDASGAVAALLRGEIPGRSISVPPDQARTALENDELVGALGRGRGLRAPDRLDYVVDIGPRLRVVVMDTVNRAGGQRGIVSAEQVAWLRSQLAAAGARDVIVASHNRLESSFGGEAAAAALAESPNVIANLSGNVHRNRIRARRTPSGGYWVIETSSLADFPQQARMLRLREAAGGARVLETWMVDQDGRGLAGISRELAFLDAQGGRPQGFAGAPGDRNARLHLPPRG